MPFVKFHEVAFRGHAYAYVGPIILNTNNIIWAKEDDDGNVDLKKIAEHSADTLKNDNVDISEINESPKQKCTVILVNEGTSAKRYTILEDVEHIYNQLQS